MLRHVRFNGRAIAELEIWEIVVVGLSVFVGSNGSARVKEFVPSRMHHLYQIITILFQIFTAQFLFEPIKNIRRTLLFLDILLIFWEFRVLVWGRTHKFLNLMIGCTGELLLLFARTLIGRITDFGRVNQITNLLELYVVMERLPCWLWAQQLSLSPILQRQLLILFLITILHVKLFWLEGQRVCVHLLERDDLLRRCLRKFRLKALRVLRQIDVGHFWSDFVPFHF